MSLKNVTDKFSLVNLPPSALFPQLLPTANSCLQNIKRTDILKGLQID